MTGWRHGGNVWQTSADLGCSVEDIIDFSSNVNPLGPPHWVYTLIDSMKPSIKHYPDPFCVRLKNRVADLYDINPSEVLPSNGTSELVYLLPQAIRPARAVIPVPSYVDYEYGARAAEIPVLRVIMTSDDQFRLPIEEIQSVLMPRDIVYLGRPNNPTGVVYDSEEIRSLAKKNRDVYFIVDQAFYDFVEDADPLVRNRPDNIGVMFSLTKILAVPGIRVGWLVAEPGIIERVAQVQPPWSVNVFAQAIGEKAVEHREVIEETRRSVADARAELAKQISELGGFHVYPSKANYLLVEVNRREIDAIQLKERLLHNQKILIRTCDNFPSLDKRFFRICVRSSEDNGRLVRALTQVVRG